MSLCLYNIGLHIT